jgi:hypothetical protein
MRTRITYHEIPVAGGTAVDFEHPDGSTVSVLSSEHMGGGSLQPFTLGVAVVHAIPEDDNQDAPREARR